MLRGSLPPVARFWRRMSITPENFFNLNVKYWILVHFHGEIGGILY